MFELSSSRGRGLNREHTKGKVTVVKRKKEKCQFMVPSSKDGLKNQMKNIYVILKRTQRRTTWYSTRYDLLYSV